MCLRFPGVISYEGHLADDYDGASEVKFNSCCPRAGARGALPESWENYLNMAPDPEQTYEGRDPKSPRIHWLGS